MKPKGGKSMTVRKFLFLITCLLAAGVCVATDVSRVKADRLARSALVPERPSTPAFDYVTSDRAAVTPFTFGAVGDGITDDTVAVSKWLDSGQILSCTGKFRILKALETTARLGLNVHGTGSTGCTIALASPTAGITVLLPSTMPTEERAPEIILHDLSFSIGSTITRSALHIVAEPTRSRVERRADLRNISFTPESRSMSASTCLEMTDLLNATIESLSCWGRHERGYVNGSSGMLVNGMHVPGELMMRDVNVYFMETGFSLEQSWQGISIESSVCVACRIGVHADGNFDGNEDWLRVLNSHFNVYDYGVLASNVFYSEIRGNLTLLNSKTRPAYPHEKNPSPACYRLEMRSPTGAASAISDNICDGHARLPMAGVVRYGVFIAGFAGNMDGQTNVRTENIMQNLDVGTMLDSDARGVIVGPDITVGVAVPKRSLSRPGANAVVPPIPF